MDECETLRERCNADRVAFQQVLMTQIEHIRELSEIKACMIQEHHNQFFEMVTQALTDGRNRMNGQDKVSDQIKKWIFIIVVAALMAVITPYAILTRNIGINTSAIQTTKENLEEHKSTDKQQSDTCDSRYEKVQFRIRHLENKVR